jgi:hypothetical protein
MGHTMGSSCRPHEHAFADGVCQWCDAPEPRMTRTFSDNRPAKVARVASSSLDECSSVEDALRREISIMQARINSSRAANDALAAENDRLRVEMVTLETKCQRILAEWERFAPGSPVDLNCSECGYVLVIGVVSPSHLGREVVCHNHERPVRHVFSDSDNGNGAAWRVVL